MSSLYTCTITMLIYKCTFVSLTRDHIFFHENEVWSMQYEFKHFLCVLYEFIAYISQQRRNYSIFFFHLSPWYWSLYWASTISTSASNDRYPLSPLISFSTVKDLQHPAVRFPASGSSGPPTLLLPRHLSSHHFSRPSLQMSDPSQAL